ncbi:MAG: hypothetical protein J6Z22_04935 [Lachnospiraceae bacterium]|nr:hypothetical protein [Lachnospiraceae bacterium]
MFQKKRLIITGLALTLAFSLTACTNKNSGDATTPKNGKNVSATEELAPEFSYVAKSLSLPEDFDPYSAIGAKDGIYGSTTDYESGTMKFLKATISNGQVGAAQTLTEFSQNGYISKFTTDGNGNIYAVMDTYPEEPDTEDEAALNAYYASLETETKRNLIKFDANGQKAYEVELNALIEDTEYFYPPYFVADDKGRV